MQPIQMRQAAVSLVPRFSVCNVFAQHFHKHARRKHIRDLADAHPCVEAAILYITTHGGIRRRVVVAMYQSTRRLRRDDIAFSWSSA